MHSHSPLQNLNDNLIVGNQISVNGPDSDPGLTVPTGIDVFADEAHGASPITGTVITQNIFKNEAIDIAVATTGGVTARFNSFFDAVGVNNLSTGSVDATLNWWKCSGGPGANGCSTATGTGIQTAPWLHQAILTSRRLLRIRATSRGAVRHQRGTAARARSAMIVPVSATSTNVPGRVR
ncbi:MAG: hypothetical protein IT165_09625 [Bryobacterales bacterium]|nr:hypothetical protein [Bryobacterales bacterium]